MAKMCNLEGNTSIHHRDTSRGEWGTRRSWHSGKKKIFRKDYHLLNLKKEVEEFVKRCDTCQRFSRGINTLATQQMSISSPWPFSQREIDILGLFPKTTG